MAAEDTELRTCRSQMLHIPLAHPLAAQHCQAGCCLPSLIPTPIRTPLARGTARTITRCDTSRFVFDQALAAVAIALQFARVVQPPAGSARFVNQILIVHTQHLVELGVFTTGRMVLRAMSQSGYCLGPATETTNTDVACPASSPRRP